MGRISRGRDLASFRSRVPEPVARSERHAGARIARRDRHAFPVSGPLGSNELDLPIQVAPIGTPADWVSENIVYVPGDVIEVSIRSTLDTSAVRLR
jgi:hypothetical protein